MKVLFIQKEGGIFGAENYHLNIIPALIQSNVQVEFLRLYTDYQLGIDSEFVKRLQALKVRVYQVDIGRFPGLKDVRQVARIINQGKYDIVHSHLIHADLYAALVKTLFKANAKFVSTKHGYDNKFTAKFGFDASKQKKTPYFLISRWAESRFDGSATISKGLLDFFRATRLTTGNKMKLIYYGFDLPEAEFAQRPADYRLGTPQLCIAGRLVAFKGHRWAIEAIDLLRKDFPHIKLVIIGSGNFERDLKNLVAELKVQDHVIFLGYRKDVSLWMKYSDAVLVPSRAEGFGVVFLEAFNSKTPVVAFNVPASNELIIDGETGLLAMPYDVSDLALKSSRILLNPDEGKRFGENGYARFKKNFLLNNMVTETINWYKSVLHA